MLFSIRGTGGLKSCTSLLDRVERNELEELVILPMKTFGGSEMSRLATILAQGKAPRLTSISASGHAVTPDSLKLLGEALGGSAVNVKTVAFGDQTMGDEGVIAFCEACGSDTRIEALDLASKGLSAAGFAAVAKAFAGLSLKELNLSRNDKAGDDGIQSFCGHVKSQSFPKMERLILSECKIGVSGVAFLCEALARIDGCQKIELAINDNAIGVKGCVALGNLISSPGQKLSSLHMARCAIGDEGISNLSSGGSVVGLENLNLAENGIAPAGARALANILGSFKDLNQLVLAGNPLESEGTQSIAQSLGGESSSLAVLDLSATQCGKEGAAAILSCKNSLLQLRLFGNKIGSAGFDAITPKLGTCTTLKELDLGGNDAGAGAVMGLLRAVANDSNSLVVLEIGGNETGHEVENFINTELKRTRPNLDVARDKPRSEQ